MNNLRVWLAIIIVIIVLGSSAVFGQTLIPNGTTISTSATWDLAGSPYIIEGSVIIQGPTAPVLTILSGVTVQFNNATYFLVGNSSTGGIIAQATTGSQIVFMGSVPSDIWLFEINSYATCLFDNCIFEDGGYSSESFLLDGGALDIRHSLIENGSAGSVAIQIDGNPLFFSLSSCTITNFTGSGVNCSGSGNDGNITDCVFQDITGNGIYYGGGNITNCTFTNITGDGIYLTSGSVTSNVTNCTLTNVTGYGIYGLAQVSNSTINNTGYYPLSLDASVVSGLTTVTLLNISSKPGIEVHGGTVVNTGTWLNFNMPYIITDAFYLDGVNAPILTFLSGETIKFAPNQSIIVGGANPGGIIAIGTPSSPIIFTGETQSPGQWAIYIESQTISTAAIFQYCNMEYSGYDDEAIELEGATLVMNNCLLSNGGGDAIYGSGTLTLSSCTIENFMLNGSYGSGIDGSQIYAQINNCEFENLAHNGIYMGGGNITNCTLSNITGDGIYLTSSSLTSNVTNCTLTNVTGYGIYGLTQVTYCTVNNTGYYPLSLDASVVSGLTTVTLLNITSKPGIEVRGGTVINTGTWLDFNMPYIITEGFYVQGVNDPVLTFLSGQTIAFAANQIIEVGSSNPGGIMAVGTPGSPIVFTGETPSPGQWAIYLESQTISTAAVFQYCNMEYTGYDEEAIDLGGASVVINNCVFNNGSGDAIYGSGTLTLSSCTIANLALADGYGSGIDGNSINAQVNNCVFENLVVDGIYMGGGNITNCTFTNITSNGIYLTSGTLTSSVTNCSLQNIGGYGIYGLTQVTNCTVNNTGNYPLSLNAYAISGLTTVTLLNITSKPGIEIRGGTVSTTGTWLNFNMPYIITNAFNVAGASSPVLTFLSGETIEFASGQYIFVGSSNPGGIAAQGTPGSPIVFTAETHSPGQWYMEFYGPNIEAVFNNCIMQYGGGDGETLYVLSGSLVMNNCVMTNGSGDAIGCSYSNLTVFTLSSCTISNYTGYGINGSPTYPTVTNCVFQNVGNDGIYVTGGQVSNCTFSTITGYPISLTAQNVPNITNCSFSNLIKPGIEVRGSVVTTSATWTNPSIPYVINGTVQVYQNNGSCKLTLSPGDILKFTPSSQLYIGGGSNSSQGGLIAQGTPSAQIYFTSIKDDSEGGDSNGDGGATTPLPGDWACITFNGGTLPGTVMDYCVVEYGGQTYNANIYCYGGQPIIRRCLITNSSGSGIYSSGGNPYIESNILTNNQTIGLKYDGGAVPAVVNFNNIINNPIGFYADTNTKGVFRYNNISNNPTAGGENIITTTIVDAELNWWGSTSGPYDGSTIGLYNPTGLGNSVTDYIDYSNWLNYNPLGANQLPAVKLLVGEIQTDVLDLKKYAIDTIAAWTWSNDPFINEAELNINLDNTVDYTTTRTPGFVGVDTVIFVANSFSTTTSITKYSTYRINKLPKIGLNKNSSWQLNIADYTNDLSTTSGVIAESYGNNQSISVSDSTQITATWLNDSILQIQALSGFASGPVSVYVTASPNSVSPYGLDEDVEQILVYPNLLSHGTFSTANDTSIWGPVEYAPGRTVLAAQSWVSTYTDSAGTQATGVWKFNFPDSNAGVKSTPIEANWIPVTAGQWYILRMRIVDDTPNNSDQSFLYGFTNLPSGGVQTDIAANVLFGVPTVWTWQETPMLAHGNTTTAYPQFQLKSGGGGNMYVDEIQIINAAPTLVDANRGNTRAFYPYGTFDLGTDTTGWGQQIYASSSAAPAISISNASLTLNFAGATSGSFGQEGIKWTANNGIQGPGNAYTYPVNVGKEVGVRATLNIDSGSFNSLGIMLVAAYGVPVYAQQAIGSIPSNLIAGAVVGILTSGEYRTVATAVNPYYQFQFGVRSDLPGILSISNVDLDFDQDDPYYGNPALFP